VFKCAGNSKYKRSFAYGLSQSYGLQSTLFTTCKRFGTCWSLCYR